MVFKSKKGQLDFFDIDFTEPEFLFALGLGVLGGFLALFIMKSAGLGLFWKIMTFIATTVAGGIVSYMIFMKG